MKKLLFFIFLVACFLRFLYFPNNIYFGFDQARDAFESQGIYKNKDIKLIGPSTSAENLFHGPLYWYLIGPFYLLGSGNPTFPAAFLLVLNAMGVFLIYWIGKTLFNQWVGVMSAFLYAFSFEQTQYALYFGNPGPAVLTIMILYLGLSLVIFKRKWIGLPLTLAGLGLSVQFEFFLLYLVICLLVIGFVFREPLLKVLTFKRIIISLLVFAFSVLTFILAELKYGFRTIKTMLYISQTVGGADKDLFLGLKIYGQKLLLHINDNVVSGNTSLLITLGIFILLWSMYLIMRKNQYSRALILVLFWFLSSIFLHIFGTSNLYYSDVGIAPALLFIVALILYQIYGKLRVLAFVIVILIFTSNIILIQKQNQKGIRNDIYVQEGMLLSRELLAIDYIYEEANNKPIVVSGLTMPLKINTTWAYLFNWYGQNKYGYLPYWSGEVATGYPGSLPVWKSQEKDYVHFSIIESTRGVRHAFVQQFLSSEEQYGFVESEKVFGDSWYAQIIVQKRLAKKD